MPEVVPLPLVVREIPALPSDAGPRLIGPGYASLMCGLSDAQMARLARAGLFPAPVEVTAPGGKTLLLYEEAAVRGWIMERIAERDARIARQRGAAGAAPDGPG